MGASEWVQQQLVWHRASPRLGSRAPLAGLALALATVACATVLSRLLAPYNMHAPFAVYYLALIAVASLLGTHAGIVTLVLSCVAAALRSSLGGPFAEPDLAALSSFAIVGTIVIMLVHRMHASERLLREREQHLTESVHKAHAQEHEIARLNQLYAALSQINQAIVWTSSRETLFERISAVLVEHGHFRSASIGWYDRPRGVLTLAARAGADDPRLATLTLEDRRAPAVRALREERPIIHDSSTNASSGEGTSASPCGAFASFPIRQGDVVCGTINVCDDERGYFQEREVALLVEAALDVSFALDHLAQAEQKARMEALAERESRFSQCILESMPGIFYLYDEQRRFLRWNRNFESVSGYRADEIAMLSPLDFFAGADKQLVDARIQEVFARGEGEVEASFVTKDGREIPHFFTGRRIVFDGMPCLVGVGINIQERKRAEAALSKSEERYRSTLDTMMEGCQLLAFDFTYLYLNDAAAKHNRRPNDQLLGRTMPEAWPGIEATHVFSMLQRSMKERIALHEETEFVFPDGQRGWFDVRAQAVPEGVFVLSIDISERKHAELALRELNESLERKVLARTHDLKVARERAESADKIKSAFLATMSHELRTPLNSIIGFTGILLKELAGPLNPEQSKQLGMVQGSARHLLDLINDVLDISKIEAGQLTVGYAPFDLRASIAQVVASVAPLAERKGLTLDVHVSSALTTIESDRRRIDQILLNLLNNAIKFTDQGSVRLLVDPCEGAPQGAGAPPEAQVRIRVVDTGIGIAAEDVERLFQPFRQVDSGLQRQHEGTGLGLAICRRLLDLLGGSVHVDSVLGQGSVFTVVLPRARRSS